jgi:hypothetical protein
MISSFLANSGLLKKWSIHSICPQPNKGSKSSSTIAAVFGVSGVIRLDCRTVFLPVYTTKHHKYPVLDTHISKVFIHCLSELFSEIGMPPVSLLSRQLKEVPENIQGEYHN